MICVGSHLPLFNWLSLPSWRWEENRYHSGFINQTFFFFFFLKRVWRPLRFLAAHLFLSKAQRGTRVCRNHQFFSLFLIDAGSMGQGRRRRRKKGQNKKNSGLFHLRITFHQRFMIKCWSQRFFHRLLLAGLLTSWIYPSERWMDNEQYVHSGPGQRWLLLFLPHSWK